MKEIKKIYYYSGTHWDREWYKSFQGFRCMLVKTTDKIIGTLEGDSAFTSFTFDGQTIVLDDYCAVRPENRGRLMKLIEDGRIHVGPWYVMPDEFLCSGESLIRNLQIGHQIASEYGAASAMKYGYVCDIFGHTGQLPQILAGFGIRGALLGRGTNAKDTPAHFLWESPDGSACITFKVPEEFGYGTFWLDVWEPYNSGRDPEWSNLVSRACRYIDGERERSPLPYVVLMDSMDHTDIQPLSPRLAAELSRAYGCPVVFESLENLAADLESVRDTLPVKRGELNATTQRDVQHSMLIPYTLSSRYDIKKENDICQTLMEKWVSAMQLFSAIGNMQYADQPAGVAGSIPSESAEAVPMSYIDIAYRYLIANHAHDSICGCSVDEVHRDMHYRFRQTRAIAEEIIFDAATSAAHMDCHDMLLQPAGSDDSLIRLDIWNPLAFARTGEVSAEIFFGSGYPRQYYEQSPAQKINSFIIHDAAGNEIPYVLLDIQNGKYVRTHGSDYRTQRDVYTVSFPASLVPFGRTSFFVEPSGAPSRYLSAMSLSGHQADNEWIGISVNDNGTINIRNKITGCEYRDLLSYIDDAEIGDGWFHVGPVHDRAVSSRGFPAGIEKIADGPSRVTFRITKYMQIPRQIADDGIRISRSSEESALRIVTEITLTSSSDYIDVTTKVENNAQDHRLRLVLPTGIGSGSYYADQAFGVTERRTGMDPSTSSWKEYEKREKAFAGMVWKRDAEGTGLLFISRYGLHEAAAYEDESGTMMITLFRAFSRTFLTNGEKDGQLQGQLEFSYRICPLMPEDTFADMLRLRDDLQTGVYCCSYPVDAGSGPGSSPISAPADPIVALHGNSLVLSLLKSPMDPEVKGFVARVFNASDAAVAAGISVAVPISGCAETDMLEAIKEIVPHTGGIIRLDFRPYEIKTLLFKF
ncbi:MAG: glycoside hydrolase family 38 N-terminal domain-containing protein [Saccharofermentanales bacterium]